jgi:predicted Zn-dependent protease
VIDLTDPTTLAQERQKRGAQLKAVDVADCVTTGEALLRAGAADAALARVQNGLLRDPEHAHAWRIYASAAGALGHPQRRVRALQIAVSLDATHAPTVLELARAHLALNAQEYARPLLVWLCAHADAPHAAEAATLLKRASS